MQSVVYFCTILCLGNVQGFDEIANKTGDGRWATKNILNYYRDMEDYNGWFPSCELTLWIFFVITLFY